ncbi:MAG: hypothetical protein JJT82_05385 [Legionellaceae bacterium]|nr:hypothetical protein [Legionellaceae bacterium]
MPDKANSIASGAERTGISDLPTVPKTLSTREQLENMRQQQVFTGQLPSKPESKLDVLKAKIPFLAGFLDRASGFAESVCKIAQMHSHHPSTLRGVGSGLHYTQVALTLIDFFRIPAIYLGAFIVGEKAPISLSKNAQWGYSSVLLALTLTALLVPAAATPIALTMASLGLCISLFSLGKMIYQRHQIKKSLRQVEQDIIQARQELDAIQQQAQALESVFELSSLTEEEQSKVQGKIHALYQKYSTCVTQLQDLHNTQLQQETRLKEMGDGAFMNKGMAIAVSSLAMIGLVLTLFFPPIGFGIMAASAGVGIVYAVGRMTLPRLAPLFRRIGNQLGSWFIRHADEGKTPATPEPEAEVTEHYTSAVPKPEAALADTPESTTPKIIRKLNGNDSASSIDSAAMQDKDRTPPSFASQVSTALQMPDPQKRLWALQAVANHLSEQDKLDDTIDLSLDREQVLPLLKAALQQIPQLPASERESLRASKHSLARILSVIAPELAADKVLERILQDVADEKNGQSKQEEPHSTHSAVL